MVAAIALGAGWNIIQSESELSLSDLALSNVEALARYEIEIHPICATEYGICYIIDDEFGMDVIFGYRV